MTSRGTRFRAGRLPFFVAGFHAIIATLILWLGWLRSDILSSFFILAQLDWPVSLPLHLLALWMFPPDPVTHGSTPSSDVAFGALLVVVGSLWYFLLALGAVALLARAKANGGDE